MNSSATDANYCLLTNLLLTASRSKPSIEKTLVKAIANRGLPPNAVRNEDDETTKVR